MRLEGREEERDSMEREEGAECKGDSLVIATCRV
jgi:hypothetical protein